MKKVLLSCNIAPINGDDWLNYVILEVTLRDNYSGEITNVTSHIGVRPADGPEQKEKQDKFLTRFVGGYISLDHGKSGMIMIPNFDQPFPQFEIRGAAILCDDPSP